MPLPPGVETVTVSAGDPLTLPDGTAMIGRLLFTAPDLAAIPGQDTIVGGTVEAPLIAGEFTATLVATDATGMNPSGWTYRVEAVLSNAPGWIRHISLPKASPTVVLADVLVPDPVVGTYTTLVDPAAVLGGVAVTGPASAGLVLTADSSAAASWQAPSGGGGGGGGTPSSTVTAETAYGQTSSAGAATTYARGDHTHGTPAAPTAGTTAGTFAAGNDSRLTNSRTPTGAAGGDLSGTYPNPAVAKVSGVTLSGTPVSGQVLTASSGTAASWQTPSGGGGSGTTIRTATVRVTDDNLSGLPAAGTWTVVQTSAGTQLKAAIAAVAGDRIRVYGAFMHIGAHFLDWVLLDSSGTIAVYATTGTSSVPAEGNPTMYPSASFLRAGSPDMFTVASGHINAGQVTVALAHQGAGTGPGNIVYAHPTYPWRLRLENIGPEPA